MSTHVLLFLCLSLGAGLRVFQLMTTLVGLLRTSRERIPEILIQPEAAAVVRRLRRGLRSAGGAVAAILRPPMTAGA